MPQPARPGYHVRCISKSLSALQTSVPAFACLRSGRVAVAGVWPHASAGHCMVAGLAAGHLMFCPCVQAGSEGITNSIEIHSISATVQEGCMKQALEVWRLRQAYHVHFLGKRVPQCAACNQSLCYESLS